MEIINYLSNIPKWLKWLIIVATSIFVLVFLERVYISKKPMYIFGKIFGPVSSQTENKNAISGKADKYTFNGEAKDIKLLDFSDDFINKNTCKYDLANVTMSRKKDKIEIKASITSKCDDGISNNTGTIIGNGTLDGDFAYIVYEGRYPAKEMYWKGVGVLRIPKIGQIKGYWLTEDTRNKGYFKFGNMTSLNR